MPPSEPEQRTRSVLDPIHGLIRLTETEMRIVDDPIFQRLRYVKQNGLLHFVFPAATHTRFEHSLGALYVAHGMLNNLALNSEVGLTKQNVRETGKANVGEAAAFPKLHSRDRNFVYRVTRLAALAHDLGHGPLSHTFDSFAPRRTVLKKVLSDSELALVKPLHEFMLEWGKDETKPAQHKKNSRVPHEVMSCVFFTKLWGSGGGDAGLAQAVCAAILGESDGNHAADLLTDPLARKWVPLIHDVIASAPADADRMDYMERDSRSIGVTYGLFDRNRVLKSLLCYRQPRPRRPVFRLGVKQSGLQAIENLMQARYELFVQVYYHKTNRAISRMLDAISEIADQKMDLFSKPPRLGKWIEKYLALSDEQFFRLLLGKTDDDSPPEVRAIADDIQKRRLWKRILDPTTKEEADEILFELQKEFSDVRDKIRLDETKPKALKDLDRGAALLVRSADGVYKVGKTRSWTEASKIIGALEASDNQFVRIYFEDRDQDTAKTIRDRALALAFDRMERRNGAS